METSKTITTVFMVAALLVMAALALSVNRQPAATQKQPVELAENIAHLERLLGIAGDHIHSVELAGCAPAPLRQIRSAPGTPLTGDNDAPGTLPQGCADLLVQSNVLLGETRSPGEFINAGPEISPAASISYVRFDGLVLKIAPTAQGRLRLRADYDAETASKFRDLQTGSEPAAPVATIAAQLNSGKYGGISGRAE